MKIFKNFSIRLKKLKFLEDVKEKREISMYDLYEILP